MFYSKIANIHNTGQSHSIVVSGNIYDVFWNGKEFIQLIPFLCEKAKGPIQVVYELNGPIRIEEEYKNTLREAWVKWKTGEDPNTLLLKELRSKENKVERYTKEFDNHLMEAIGNPNLALEFLRQLTFCSRFSLKNNLFIIVEAADMLLPAGNGDIASLNDKQLQRIAIVQDWIGHPAFINGHDTVLFLAESKSLIHQRISKLPQVLSVDIPSPDGDSRKQLLIQYKIPEDKIESIVRETAGLSLCALQQLLKGSVEIDRASIVAKVEEFIQSQLGEDVIEFKKPSHKLDDCVGFASLKKFLRTVLIPRMQISGNGTLPGAAVAGPIGGGKTYLFEAVASEMNMPVLVLKNIRSQWFGQTDVIFERLRRVLEALDRVLIFCDEADTQFGGVGEGSHETERRLTGKVQAMMSDPKLKGKVYWLLMTARIHLLSPDIRRPGRVGDLIIPVFDPVGDDRIDFLKWALKGIKIADTEAAEDVNEIVKFIPNDYSSASFASLRSNLKYKETFPSLVELLTEIRDFIQPAISQTRRYQTLQALVNCTRRSLLPDPDVTEETRKEWELEIRHLETLGVK